MLQCSKETSFDINLSTWLTKSVCVAFCERGVVIDRYQSGCCYLLAFTIRKQLCNVILQSFI